MHFLHALRDLPEKRLDITRPDGRQSADQRMIRMIVKNKVEDFARWKYVFDSHSADQAQSGLSQEHLWRGLDDANEVFFVLAVTHLDKAKAFISAPEAAETGRRAGVRDGNYWFVE